jgi:divalent metal cation (Fe/Co/Zn/Cd) transporter
MKTSEHIGQTETVNLLTRGLVIEYVSLAWMTIECMASIGAGLFSGSLALIAFGGDSLIELISSYTVAGHLRRIRRGQAGECERDGRVERIATFLLFTLIPVIGLGALYSYFSGIQAEPTPLGTAVAFGAVLIMPALWHEKARIGRLTSCMPLTIDAVESATCFLMSIALLASLLVNYLWKIAWADYVATVVILCFVAKEALEALSEMRENPMTS